MLPHPDRTVSLREVGLWVIEQRITHLPEGSDPETRARLLNNLSVWQGALGQREAALVSARESGPHVPRSRGVAAGGAPAQPRSEPQQPGYPAEQARAARGGAGFHAGGRRHLRASSRRRIPKAFLPDLAESVDNLGMDAERARATRGGASFDAGGGIGVLSHAGGVAAAGVPARPRHEPQRPE